jgi:hypothetical protein
VTTALDFVVGCRKSWKERKKERKREEKIRVVMVAAAAHL